MGFNLQSLEIPLTAFNKLEPLLGSAPIAPASYLDGFIDGLRAASDVLASIPMKDAASIIAMQLLERHVALAEEMQRTSEKTGEPVMRRKDIDTGCETYSKFVSVTRSP